MFAFTVLLRDVVQQLPPPNYRTLEYLSRHLYRVSLRGNDTGMTAKNVAIVWAPNLLRSKSIEVGGVAALQGRFRQSNYPIEIICIYKFNSVFLSNP